MLSIEVSTTEKEGPALADAGAGLYWCAGHGAVLTGESPVTGIYRQV